MGGEIKKFAGRVSEKAKTDSKNEKDRESMEKKEALKVMGYPIAGIFIGRTVMVILSNYGPLKNAGEIITVPPAAAVVAVVAFVVHRQFRNE